MANPEKKVEVRFGAFSCSIEGYDDPVAQMREVLGMMQKMIAETPALAEGGQGFDTEPISDALDDSAPGIVVIRNEGDAPTKSEEPKQSFRDEEAAAEDAEVSVAAAEGAAASDSGPLETPSPDQEQDDGPSGGLMGAASAAVALAGAGIVDLAMDQPEASADHAEAPTDQPAADAQITDFSGVEANEQAISPEAFGPQPPVADSALDDALQGPPHPEPGATAVSDPAPTDDRHEQHVTETVTEAAQGTVAEAASAPSEAAVEEASQPESDAGLSGAAAAAYASFATPVITPPAAAADTIPTNIFAPPSNEEPAAVADDASQEEPEEPAPATLAADALADDAPPINIFATPAVDDEPEVVAEDPAPIGAAKTDPQPAPESATGSPINIFADPTTQPTQPDAAPAAKIEPSTDPTPPADTSTETNIFASAGPAPEPESAAPQASGFQSLLQRVHGTGMMGAPGEAPPPADPAPPSASPPADGPSAAELAVLSGDQSIAGELAACAAWLTVVKGRPSFSRREVMEVLETIPAGEPRELADRIRGFGRLVRSGRLMLVDDGIFAMAQPDREQFQNLLSR
ncbi:MAG: hypothetical protein AAF674_12220 [Pseudomonadota bacterium]